MKQHISLLLSALLCLLLNTSCGADYLETTSTQDVDESQMFASESNAQMAINGIHRMMHESDAGWYGQGGFQIFMLASDMMAEDMVFTKSNACLTWFAQLKAHQDPSNRDNEYYYKFFYRVISNANKIITATETMESTNTTKNIRAQALAYRAFCYFYLVQMYGERYVAGSANDQPGVILRLENSEDNRPRETVGKTYEQINADLDEAIALLSSCGIVRPDKTHINVDVARGLKARVLLTQGRWSEAAAMADLVISQSGAKLDPTTYTCTDVDYRMSSAASPEWLWGKVSQPDQEGVLRHFHAFCSNSYASYNRNTPRCILNLLYDQMSETDTRRGCWLPNASADKNTGYFVITTAGAVTGNRFDFMSNKFLIPGTANAGDNKAAGDVPYMRLPEMLLIKAEGLARSGNDIQAAEVLAQLAVSRDPAYAQTTAKGEALIAEIMLQRRLELWGEGFRWFDLKRLALPLDRGPKPRDGYNQGGWKSAKKPTNIDPLASNFNMYDDQAIGEQNRYRSAGNAFWQWLFPLSETMVNPLLEQNPLQNDTETRPE